MDSDVIVVGAGLDKLIRVAKPHKTNLDSQVLTNDGEGTFLGGCIFSGRAAGRAAPRAIL